jgi:hypothetical protein
VANLLPQYWFSNQKMTKMQVCYTVKFKLKVFLYAQKQGNEASGRKCDVVETNIREW